MSQRLLSPLCAIVVLSAITLAPGQSRATSLKDLNLVGTWNCSAGHQKYTESWERVLGGAYLRATDSGPGMHSAEHTITIAKDGTTVSGVDLFSDGMQVMHGTGSSGHATLQAVFPSRMNTHVVFNRVSAAKYTVDVTGSSHGKPFKDHNVCTKG